MLNLQSTLANSPLIKKNEKPQSQVNQKLHIKSNFTSLVNKERQILTIDSDDIIALQ